MREFASTYIDSLMNGLRSDVRTKTSTQSLETCYGLKPTEFGLAAIDVPTFPGDVTPSHSFPHPQLYAGKDNNYVLQVESTVAKLYVCGKDWNISSTPVNNVVNNMADNGATTVDLDTAFGMQVFRFHDFNGTVFFISTTAIITNAAIYTGFVGGSAAETITAFASCIYNDRLVLGYLEDTSASRLDDALWVKIFKEWRQVTNEVVSEDFAPSDGRNLVMIGTQGGGDVDLPFSLELAMLCGYKETELETVILDAIRTKKIVLKTLPGDDLVSHVRQLGNNLIVYGQKNVWALQPENDGDFTWHRVFTMGCGSRDGCDGDEREHIFVGPNAVAYRLTEGLQVSRLGYEEFLTVLGNMKVTFDPHWRDFYITDTDDCFILTPTGLGKARYRLHSLVRDLEVGGPSYGLYGGFETDATAPFEVVTQDMDFAKRAMKTITQLEVGYTGATSVKLGTEYRYAQGDSWIRYGLTAVNTEDAVHTMITAPDLRIVITGTPTTTTRIEYVTVKWQSPDRRTVRGLVIQPEGSITE